MLIKLISKEFIQAHVREFITLTKDWSYCSWKEENFLYELPKKWDFSFALYDNDQLAGFCFASNKLPGVYYIHLLFVSKAFRGRSAGANMINKAKEIAAKQSIHAIELRCPESNSQAIDFYLNNHFKIINKLKDEISGPEADFYLRLTF